MLHERDGGIRRRGHGFVLCAPGLVADHRPAVARLLALLRAAAVLREAGVGAGEALAAADAADAGRAAVVLEDVAVEVRARLEGHDGAARPAARERGARVRGQVRLDAARGQVPRAAAGPVAVQQLRRVEDEAGHARRRLVPARVDEDREEARVLADRRRRLERAAVVRGGVVVVLVHVLRVARRGGHRMTRGRIRFGGGGR
jgi:hypothetical protein